jgi:hypothetical protein
VRAVWEQLHAFCAAREWRGIDPYDGLISPLAQFLPGKFTRQAWTQLHRRSPVNLRPLCGIKPQLNSMAVALFAMGSGDAKLRELLLSLRNADGGWGYPFPWQSRAFYAPANTSNLICTALAAKALGCDVREFVEKNLLRDGWISYIAGNDTQVHNINMMGAALLGRADCMEWSVKRQRPDGSWWYGEAENQHWIDNFHTGYCLVAREWDVPRSGGARVCLLGQDILDTGVRATLLPRQDVPARHSLLLAGHPDISGVRSDREGAAHRGLGGRQPVGCAGILLVSMHALVYQSALLHALGAGVDVLCARQTQ